ncbi:Geranylgeranyl transferase type-2 subunit alpha [Phytophthora citrophthora]|uniref:Geranylgeranyl transferase type-2 subunit alpha n=1 Tax=Phytophthora citrophthora TaxID=4793 RepID=A0AAD9GKA6_9STRA|nr:Geranylgeranyl transferase type-2 subunit alpha [Phytophthora citrophthora]
MELTADIIKRRSGHYDVSLVALLDVSRMKIHRLAQLEACLNLLELNVTHNELRSLDGLPALPLLRCLKLSNNQLTSLDSLPRLPLLEELTLANNRIRSIDFLELSTKLPSLRVLDFNENPLDSSAGARASKAFPGLFILNGEALTLARMLEDISSTDYTKLSDEGQGNDHEEGNFEFDDNIEKLNDEAISVNDFINESTGHLEELLKGCKERLATTEPAFIFPSP